MNTDISIPLDSKILVETVKLGNNFLRMISPAIVEGVIVGNEKASEIIVNINNQEVIVAKNGKFILKLKKGIHDISIKIDGNLAEKIDQIYVDAGERLFITITLPLLNINQGNIFANREDVNQGVCSVDNSSIYIDKIIKEIELDDKQYSFEFQKLAFSKKKFLFSTALFIIISILIAYVLKDNRQIFILALGGGLFLI